MEVLHDLGVVGGRADGSFAPDQPVTRAEFAKMLASVLGLDLKPGDTVNPVAADVRTDWSLPYLSALYRQNLMVGELVGGQRYFYPDRTITRAEAATIVGRALHVADAHPTDLGPDIPDLGQVPSWARASVQILTNIQWLNGFPDGRFAPRENLRRDQAARLLGKFIGL